MPTSLIPYSYHDYITVWSRFMLHQNENMSHSWFVNFNKNFTSYLPLWFDRWWTQFGPISDIFLKPLLDAFECFKKFYKVDAHGAKFPALLHFVKCHKIPWILKWQYEKNGDVLSRHWYVKWWGKFPHTQSIIATISREFLLLLLNPLSLLMLPLPLPPRMLSLQQKLRALLLMT